MTTRRLVAGQQEFALGAPAIVAALATLGPVTPTGRSRWRATCPVCLADELIVVAGLFGLRMWCAGSCPRSAILAAVPVVNR